MLYEVITDRNGRDDRFLTGDMPVAVGYPGACGHRLDLGDMGAEAHHRPEVELPPEMFRREGAVEGDAGTDEVALGELEGEVSRAVARNNFV